MRLLPEALVNNDQWRRLVAGTLLAIIVGGLPVFVTLWREQSDLSERLARLEEMQRFGPVQLIMEVNDLSGTVGRIEDHLGAVSTDLREMRVDVRRVDAKMSQLERRLERLPDVPNIEGPGGP